MKELVNLLKKFIELGKEAFATYAAKLTLQGDTGERSAWSIIVWAYAKTVALFFFLFVFLFLLNSWDSEVVYYAAPIVSILLVLAFLWVYVLTFPIVIAYETINGKKLNVLEGMRDIFAMCLFIGLFFTYIPISGSGGFFLVPTIMIAMIIIFLVGKINREKSRKRMTAIAVVVIVLSVFYMIAPERASDWYGSAWEFVTGKEFVPRGSKKVKYVEENGDPCVLGKDGKPAKEIYDNYTVVKNNQNDNQDGSNGITYNNNGFVKENEKEITASIPSAWIIINYRKFSLTYSIDGNADFVIEKKERKSSPTVRITKRMIERGIAEGNGANVLGNNIYALRMIDASGTLKINFN